MSAMAVLSFNRRHIPTPSKLAMLVALSEVRAIHATSNTWGLRTGPHMVGTVSCGPRAKSSERKKETRQAAG
jgi:hypothetical protein